MAITAGLAAGAAGQLSLPETTCVVGGAWVFASAPDYTERGPFGLWHIPHRTWTHYLPTGFAVAVVFTLVLLMFAPPELDAYAAMLGLGALVGWWAHPFADALTDRGCWLWKRQRQVLLPDHMRIRVYTIVRRRHWLTGKVTTVKRPSRGEQSYRAAALVATVALVFVHVALAAHTMPPPPQ